MRERHLDLIGLKCPLPALKARQALCAMALGDVLVLACTDPLARIDIPHLVRETGQQLDAEERQGDTIVFRIRKMAELLSPRESAG